MRERISVLCIAKKKDFDASYGLRDDADVHASSARVVQDQRRYKTSHAGDRNAC